MSDLDAIRENRWLGAECELTAAISHALAAYDKDHER